MRRTLDTLLEWVGAPEQERLRRAFTVWLRRVLLPRRLPGVHLDSVENLEVRAMLAERVEEWTKDWREQGIQDGRLEGRLEGRREGRLEGRLEGAREALADVLEVRFGGMPKGLQERIGRLEDIEALRMLRRRALVAGSLEEFEADAANAQQQE